MMMTYDDIYNRNHHPIDKTNDGQIVSAHSTQQQRRNFSFSFYQRSSSFSNLKSIYEPKFKELLAIIVNDNNNDSINNNKNGLFTLESLR